MTTVLIVEDEPEARRQLAEHLATAGFDITCASSVAEGVAALRARRPDVLLVDLGLTDGSGLQVIRAASAVPNAPEIMVVSVFGDERNVVSAIEAGASGYLLKDADQQQVSEAIQTLIAGGSPITPAIARHILKRFQTPNQGGEKSLFSAPPSSTPAPSPASHENNNDASSGGSYSDRLTPRETDVLGLISRGYSNREIADLLELSVHTVTSHIKHIYSKLAVQSRSAAVFEATQLGLIDIHRA